MPMTEGGGVGASRPRRRLGPQGPNTGYTPGTEMEEDLNLLAELKRKNTTPMDVLREGAGDVGELLRMPGDILNMLNTGHTPDTLARDMGSAVVESIPTSMDELETMLQENPLHTALDLAGGIGTATRLPRTLARGASLMDELLPLANDLDPAYPQAIGAWGRRLEEGDTPFQESLTPHGMTLMEDSEFSGSMPDLAHLTWNDDEIGLGVTKLGYQGRNEVATNILNRGGGGRVRMPGSQWGNWEYTPRPAIPYNVRRAMREAGEDAPFTSIGDPVTGEGALMEYIHGVKPVEKWEDLDWDNPQTALQMRASNILDEATGTVDRGYNANMFMDENRVPIHMDSGIGWGGDQGMFKSARAWAFDDITERLGVQPWEMLPDEIDYVEKMLDFARNNPDEFYMQSLGPVSGGQVQLDRVIANLEKILEDRSLHNASGEPYFSAGAYPFEASDLDASDLEPWGGLDSSPDSQILQELTELVENRFPSGSERGPWTGDPLPSNETLTAAEKSWAAPVNFNAPPAMDPVEAMRQTLAMIEQKKG